jgi:hypothetical protein
MQTWEYRTPPESQRNREFVRIRARYLVGVLSGIWPRLGVDFAIGFGPKWALSHQFPRFRSNSRPQAGPWIVTYSGIISHAMKFPVAA